MVTGNSDPNEHAEFIERRIREWDRRREINITEKLNAIEKYFNMLVAARSDAMAIAISRIQNDSKDCLKRCSAQVATFYNILGELKENDIRQKLILEAIHKSIDETDREVEKNDRIRTDEDDDLETRILALEASSRSFWTVQLPAVVTLAITVTIGILAGWAWILDYIKKMHGAD